MQRERLWSTGGMSRLDFVLCDLLRFVSATLCLRVKALLLAAWEWDGEGGDVILKNSLRIVLFSSADLVHVDALHLNQTRGCLQAPLWCLATCVSAPFYHRSHYTPRTRELLVWIPLKEHYNMNEIYCTGAKCVWLPRLVIRRMAGKQRDHELQWLSCDLRVKNPPWFCSLTRT